MWDLSLEDDGAELRRVQNREQPELLAGSPPSDDFNSLLNTCVESQEISKLKAERNRATDKKLCTSLQVADGNAEASFMNIPKIPRAGTCLRFNPLSATRKCTALMVRCVAGV